jgi:DMSO/TMAO reductase YedYZ molybdopterin-dependent catalytic subunit
VDVLLESAELLPDARFAITWADPDYTTNLPLPDLLNGQAYIALEYEGAPLAPEHGGPARLLVANRYLWKSAKWVRGIEFTAEDRSGFWESLGYNNHGDPWREERYTGD